MAPIIFHIDVNSAYLSWTAVEQLKNGAAVDLREIPAIIGGDQKSRHGVVLAKSPAAKRYGIRTGEPVANAFRKCPNLAMYPMKAGESREITCFQEYFLETFQFFYRTGTFSYLVTDIQLHYIRTIPAVSYTHLDVYKRQRLHRMPYRIS